MLMNAQRIEIDYMAVRAGLEAKLTSAHGQIEKKFLDGGAVLISIMEILNRLIGSLDRLTGSLDENTTSETMGGIEATAKELGTLPAFEDGRQKGFVELASVCRAMQGSISEMREIMRYLRTFAISVKITAAGLDDFVGFADEIRERIQSGESEVNRFAKQVHDMHGQLEKAQEFSRKILQEYSDVVPRTVADLSGNAARISGHHGRLAEMANQVKQLARGVQGKITSVLSALQIGDITRQRIEHIQSIFQLFDEFVAGEGASLTESDRVRIGEVIRQLAAAQMEETATDFQRECRNIHTNMTRFIDDTREILRLRDGMTDRQNGGGENVLKALETGVTAAVGLVSGVQETSSQADAVAQSTSETAQSLLRGIEVIRTIKTDIHYMALNSNLRCSKLGDEGRSVNVVSAELRIYAGKLEVPADAVMNELQRLEAAAGAFSSDRGSGSGDIAGPLSEALSAIRGVSGRMDAGIEELAREGQEVFTKVSAAISTLDFESELGDVIEDCVSHSAGIASPHMIDISDLADSVAGLGARILKLYTMAQEREIHSGFLPAAAGAVAATPTTSAATSDEDLFEDALF
ncbi:chemotaxis protein [Rhizobium sp. LjRoot254]|uniref:chemotaxis protein n=1 Tax=Rhizobium sp. LjRoot254 TaxID=3342297 RepID=UPI003ECE0D1D